jgi:hypothetical protein
VKDASAAVDPHEKIAHLKKALELEPLHSKANRMLFQLEGAKSMRQDKPAPLGVPIEELAPLKKVSHKKKRGPWFYIGIFAFILSSASAAFFALSFTGSPIAGAITDFITGRHPVTTINGTPIKNVPNAVLTVQPYKTQTLSIGQKITDVLDNGILQEYNTELDSKGEITFAVWFVSPTANRVGHNIAIFDPSGNNAESICRRDKLMSGVGDTNVTLTCNIQQTGIWKVRLLGIDGDSTGAYFITVDHT